ncbi:hypothetical protein ACR8G9_22840, partial [Salmonella enterica subsp. enterica serovar Paratyphi A]
IIVIVELPGLPPVTDQEVVSGGEEVAVNSNALNRIARAEEIEATEVHSKSIVSTRCSREGLFLLLFLVAFWSAP